MGDEQVAFALDNRRVLVVDRATASATYWGATPPTAADSVHPLLTAAAAVGRWAGYELFHAAAFVADGRVWGRLGERESGKSTTAAWLANEGYPVVCDDMLALRGRTAFAGPRCVDLRPEPARRLGMGVEAHAEGPRQRWRVALPPIEAELDLGGWVMLGWADVVEAVRLRPGKLGTGAAPARQAGSRCPWPPWRP